MRRRNKSAVHPLGCRCRKCEPQGRTNCRAELAIKATIRALFLIAALFAIPFIIAHALASAKGDQR